MRGLGGLFRFFFFQAEDGIRDFHVTGVQTCALPISRAGSISSSSDSSKLRHSRIARRYFPLRMKASPRAIVAATIPDAASRPSVMDFAALGAAPRLWILPGPLFRCVFSKARVCQGKGLCDTHWRRGSSSPEARRGKSGAGTFSSGLDLRNLDFDFPTAFRGAEDAVDDGLIVKDLVARDRRRATLLDRPYKVVHLLGEDVDLVALHRNGGFGVLAEKAVVERDRPYAAIPHPTPRAAASGGHFQARVRP